MREFFVIALFMLSLVLLALPIVYTFLRLYGKVGPEDWESASVSGIVLYLIGLIGFGNLLYHAIKLSDLVN